MDPLGGILTIYLMVKLLQRLAERADDVTADLEQDKIEPIQTNRPLRDRATNAWRAAWADLRRTAARRAKAGAQVISSSPGRWARWRQQATERAERVAADRLRPWVRFDPDRDTDRIREEAQQAAAEYTAPRRSAGTEHKDTEIPTSPPHATSGQKGTPGGDAAPGPREPIRVPPTTVTKPQLPTTPVSIEGSAAVSGTVATTTDVTGVVSGQQAAMRIARSVQNATEAYRLALRRAIVATSALGDQATSSRVGFSPNSTVIVSLREAAEVLAAEIPNAHRACATVAPMFGRVAQEFARRNS